MGVKRATSTQELPTVLVFGGSFDPVHNGHVALVKHFVEKLQIQEVRIIPAGQPWQKDKLVANAEQRVAMLELAFTDVLSVPLVIDQQEIERAKHQVPSFSVDTLSNLRAELGSEVALILLIGADQLHNLATWKDWPLLFELASIVVAARPGYSVQLADLPQALASRWQAATTNIKDLKHHAFGKTHIETDLAWDVSATQLRTQLQQQLQQTSGKARQTKQSASLIPHKVLDYIQQHRLYQEPF